jgi:hypothetical protein
MWQGWSRDTPIIFFTICNTLIVNKKVDGLCGIMSENDISIVKHVIKNFNYFSLQIHIHLLFFHWNAQHNIHVIIIKAKI